MNLFFVFGDDFNENDFEDDGCENLNEDGDFGVVEGSVARGEEFHIASGEETFQDFCFEEDGEEHDNHEADHGDEDQEKRDFEVVGPGAAEEEESGNQGIWKIGGLEFQDWSCGFQSLYMSLLIL